MAGGDRDHGGWEGVETYEVLEDHDVDDDPPPLRPIGPGDVFAAIEIGHLAEPFTGHVMVVGHPCSLRRGLVLQPDVPVAPVTPPGIPTSQHGLAERVLPVRKLLPPGTGENHVVQLTRTTTIAGSRLHVADRVAALTPTGIVALQQRVVGNQTRVKVPPRIIAAHIRGPLTELELLTDWREEVELSGLGPDALDAEFDAFMSSTSGFDELTWRVALGEHEHARARAVAAMSAELQARLDP
jgi:hypothetical protein